MALKKHIKVALPGREEIELSLSFDSNGDVGDFRLTGIGGPSLLKILIQWRPLIKGPLSSIPLPVGTDPAAILMREVLLRAKGQWNPPYQEQELCHCRAVPTEKVDMAIITGAHTPERVSELTSASTACGTCRPDVQAMINYRLK